MTGGFRTLTDGRHDHVRHRSWMDEPLIGYARCSNDEQDEAKGRGLPLDVDSEGRNDAMLLHPCEDFGRG
jgi:hypothetical protein